ncbi:hypothetical protein [Spirosoma foliorum]|uniref:Uncharacterized protein n=1 Tax=Spirosoma foliorum TaxID=2710596 RepID=A0A7G5H3D2_9BACT|nr:hypothetical protein [Spirosoma foliorum]QMW05624.1 hypothetical protein H3H32_12400 [Spirosoma foliorum]
MKLAKFEKNRINFDDFQAETSLEKLLGTFASPGLGPSFPLPSFFSIDTLSVTRTVGKGRTNLTFIQPDIVQADAMTPYASFDRRNSPIRNPTIQMHFEPVAYGITSVSNYVMVFLIENSSQNQFSLQGNAGLGTVGNAGTKVLNGKQAVALTFSNVPPSQQIYGYLEQTAGSSWNYYSTTIRFPLPVVHS